MKEVYTDLDIKILLDDTSFYILNIVFETFTRSIPRHSHGNNSYEIHYILSGCGQVNIDDTLYAIRPKTLYVTGPHIEHEQFPDADDPMAEYCIYFKIAEDTPVNHDSIAYKFAATHFWFGQDMQNMQPVIEQLFYELQHQYAGYMIQVKSLLQQCIVKMVRNYEKMRSSKTHFTPSSLVDSKYLIVEESFIYDYNTITLELLAHRLGLSIRQTERFFKSYYGKTFMEKKKDAKMSAAEILLRDRKYNISDIADHLNYSSVQHFSYAFKQYFGISPTQYRNQLSNSNE